MFLNGNYQIILNFKKKLFSADYINRQKKCLPFNFLASLLSPALKKKMELCRTIFGSAAHAEPFYSSGVPWKNLKGSVQLCRTKKGSA